MESRGDKPGWTRRTLALVGWSGAAAAGSALLSATALTFWLDSRVERQIGRNKYLEEEIAKLDGQIVELRKLKEQMAALLAKKGIVETLSRRPIAAGLLDRLARLCNDGAVALRSVERHGDDVTISGSGPSYLDIDAFIRKIAESGYLERPWLSEVKATDSGKVSAPAIQFTVTAYLKRDREHFSPDASKSGASK